MTKFLNISTDGTLTGNSDSTVVSEKAIKTYVDGSIPTVNNATITITQGGVTKGSFTLNQASGDTIALDAGGGGGSSTLAGLSDVTITSPSDGQVLTYDNGDWVNTVPTGGYHPGLLSWERDDHIRNDVQWLRADTFSWQDGSVYQAAYNHLVADISGKTATSETIAGTTISFYLADDGHKITTDENAVAAIYSATGVAWYYVLDTVNTRFKLPRRHSTQVIRSYKSGSKWYRLYADGWVEQGGNSTDGSNSQTHTFLIGMRDTDYSIGGLECSTANSTGGYTNPGWYSKTTSSFSTRGIGAGAFEGNKYSWMVSGWSDVDTSSEQGNEKYLYFYVGEFTQVALENTAGINASLFNSKVDVGHEVIAFQAPTSANNYTWYRKYADGWLEQGGFIAAGTTSGTVSMPLSYSDTHYQITTTPYSEGANFTTNITSFPASASQFTWNSYNNSATTKIWEAKGMAA